jgi:DNA-directed RNA polymerase subunit RPC12/RpoP
LQPQKQRILESSIDRDGDTKCPSCGHWIFAVMPGVMKTCRACSTSFIPMRRKSSVCW